MLSEQAIVFPLVNFKPRRNEVNYPAFIVR
jgi:hypothetical protein